MKATKKLNPEKSTQKYTCPMHPEVRSETPGKCPKCSMDLVKAVGNARLK